MAIGKPLSMMRGDMYALAAKVERDAQDNFRDTVSYLGQNLIPITPVDTGRARQNWQISYDAPTSFSFPVPGPRGAGSALLGRQVLNYRALSRAIEGFHVWVVNNAPYILRLNASPPHSPQAPAGFIESAIADTADQARRIPLIR